MIDVAPVVPPDVFLNLRFSKDKAPDQEAETNTHVSVPLVHSHKLSVRLNIS